MEDKLLCGAGKELITPPDELIPNLFGLMRSSFDRVYDDLYVRVLALSCGKKKMLIISVDLDKGPCPVEFTERLEEETGVPKENMLYFGIHAHAVPITGYRPFEKRNDITKKDKPVQEAVKAYEAYILEQMVKAALRAVNSQKPVRYGYGFGKSYINVKRTYIFEDRTKNGEEFVGEGWCNDDKVDRTTFVMRFEDMAGKPVAFLINYPMHNVSMFLNDAGSGKSAISSDIGGNVSKYMEAEFDGAVAVWSSGAAGDHNCICSGNIEYPDPATGKYRQEMIKDISVVSAMMRHMAATHFQDVLNINKQIQRLSESATLSVATEYSHTPAASGVMESPQYKIDKKDSYHIRLRLLRIGEVALIGCNGELYNSLGQAIKAVSPMKNTVIITHDASLVLDNPGYIYDDDTLLAIQKHGESGLPGWREFTGVPYTIRPSLEECTKRLFENQY